MKMWEDMSVFGTYIVVQQSFVEVKLAGSMRHVWPKISTR
jgi:hypothetical protein